MRRVGQKELLSPYLRLLLYGQPGSTKTRTGATAALDDRCYPVLMLEAGGNPVSIRDFARVPDILHMESLADYNRPYNWLAAGQQANDPFCREFGLKPPYKTVFVDSITQVQRYSFALAVGNSAVAPGTLPAPTEIQHFNRVLGQMVNFAGKFLELPMHVILTSLEHEDKDQTTGMISYKPLLWGQSAGEVSGIATVVARMVHRARIDARIQKEATGGGVTVTEDPITNATTSVALFRPSGKYVAKDQTGCLGPYMIDPTITKMLDLIYKPQN